MDRKSTPLRNKGQQFEVPGHILDDLCRSIQRNIASPLYRLADNLQLSLVCVVWLMCLVILQPIHYKHSGRRAKATDSSFLSNRNGPLVLFRFLLS